MGPFLPFVAALLAAVGGWALFVAAPAGKIVAPTIQSPRVVLVTGSTDGLGREVALRLAATGAQVIVHGRNRDRGEEVVAQIARSGRGTARFYRADLASLDEVRAFAQQVLSDYDRLDLLVNNAGIALFDQRDRLLSADGNELHFAVNYLSGFLLTRMLLHRLKASAPARVINVSSASQEPVDFGNVMLARGYSYLQAYGQSKLAQVMFTFDLARELNGTGVSVYAVHPASFMDTHMILSAGRKPESTVEEGADAVMRLVIGTGLRSGDFYEGFKRSLANSQAYDEAARSRLRTLSMQLTGAK